MRLLKEARKDKERLDYYFETAAGLWVPESRAAIDAAIKAGRRGGKG
jgi:hypothetical protein